MLKQRLATAVVLISGFMAALFLLPDPGWALLMLAFIVAGGWEWARLAGFSAAGQWLFSILVLMVGVLLLPDVWPVALEALQYQVLFWSLPLAALFWVALVPLWLHKRYRVRHRLLSAVAGLLVLLPAWLALLHLRKVSPWLVLLVVMVVAIADSAAYFSGKAFGRRKLAPEISPGKTWEGVIGAALAVSLLGLALSLVHGFSPWIIVGLLLLMVLSVIGDLFESLLKRQAGLKDSGNILPGHGGILDRVDGLTSTLPLALLYLHFPLYIAILHA